MYRVILPECIHCKNIHADVLVVSFRRCCFKGRPACVDVSAMRYAQVKSIFLFLVTVVMWLCQGDDD